ncbi:hypothetical protein PBI_TREYKAY_88 [Mycobacterium phage TreyKay]|uniref:Uncharacterized protein n=1 Tax=Mycobacterium phage Prithvi TaxID=2484215 RepID=A0A3G3M1K4_9CAUD|nr:hypothetical protein I5H05_gp15 [Mycobacterium phage Prithvi]ASZ75157.1 hypothetical protein PBI_TREYKAY_88 [Mycobacterium phage TreyKay]AYR00350.1 hypothetical protein PBI_PRITHVI_88 [Mycobacterium phage Prithvi]
MLNDPNAHSLLLSSRWRQGGKTTALLDVALANARRGLEVVFWSGSARQCTEAFRMGRALAEADRVPFSWSPANGNEWIRYDSGGRVRFIWGHQGSRVEPSVDMAIQDSNGLTGLIERRGERRGMSVI